MRKRLFTILLTSMMFILLLFVGANAADVVASGSCGAEGSNVTWSLGSDGLLTINGSGAMANYNSSPVPWYNYRSSVKTVSVANGVTSIGSNAFAHCESLTGVNIGNSVTSIDYAAFSGCSSLTSVTIPDSVTSIGDYAFQYCKKLTNVSIGKRVTNIGDYAFYCCYALTGVNIPDGVTSIGPETFSYCESLTSVTIPNSVTSIGTAAFRGCRSLTKVTIPNKVTSIGNYAFNDCDSLTSATIGTSVTSIGEHAFRDCDSLKSVNIPSSVTSIGAYAFYNCPGVKSISIPASVKTIEEYALGYCDSDVGKDYTFTAIVAKGSAAETYCKMYGVNYTYAEENPFTDVAPGKFYYQPVLWAVENGITNGLTATTFAPDETCTRGQVVTFLWRAAGKPEPKSSSNPFTDVVAGKFYYKAVLWAVENNITSGMTKTTFEPNSPCTRGQVVTFQWRAAGKPEPKSTSNPFTDVPSGKFYSKAVLWAVENGITSGMSKTTFVPDNICTRGQIVTFLYRQYS